MVAPRQTSGVEAHVSDFTNEWNKTALAYAWRHIIPQRILEGKERGTVHLSDFNSEWNKAALKYTQEKREKIFATYQQMLASRSALRRIWDFVFGPVSLDDFYQSRRQSEENN